MGLLKICFIILFGMIEKQCPDSNMLEQGYDIDMP